MKHLFEEMAYEILALCCMVFDAVAVAWDLIRIPDCNVFGEKTCEMAELLVGAVDEVHVVDFDELEVSRSKCDEKHPECIDGLLDVLRCAGGHSNTLD